MKNLFKAYALLSLTVVSFAVMAEDFQSTIEFKLGEYNNNSKFSTIAAAPMGLGVNYNLDVDHGNKIKTLYNYGITFGERLGELTPAEKTSKSIPLNVNLNAKVGAAYQTGERTSVGAGMKYSYDNNSMGTNHDVSIFAQGRYYDKKKNYLMIEASKSVTHAEGWGVNVGAGLAI